MITDLAIGDVAAMVIVIAVLVVAGYLVATLIRINKTVAQSEHLLSKVNETLPEILREIRQTSENVRVVSARARDSMEDASVLVHAINDVGQTVNRVHGVVREQGATALTRLLRVVSGVRAVADTLKSRARKEGGDSHGKF